MTLNGASGSTRDAMPVALRINGISVNALNSSKKGSDNNQFDNIHGTGHWSFYRV